MPNYSAQQYDDKWAVIRHDSHGARVFMKNLGQAQAERIAEGLNGAKSIQTTMREMREEERRAAIVRNRRVRAQIARFA